MSAGYQVGNTIDHPRSNEMSSQRIIPPLDETHKSREEVLPIGVNGCDLDGSLYGVIDVLTKLTY